MREVAGWDPSRYDRILDQPLVEVLAAYSQRLRDRAADAFRHECLLYQIAAVWDSEKKLTPPKLPAILE